MRRSLYNHGFGSCNNMPTGRFSTALTTPQANSLHQPRNTSHEKHMPPCIRCVSQWITSVLNIHYHELYVSGAGSAGFTWNKDRNIKRVCCCCCCCCILVSYKMISSIMLFPTGRIPMQRPTIKCLRMTSQWCHRYRIPSMCSDLLNFPQNACFGFNGNSTAPFCNFASLTSHDEVSFRV